MRKVVVSLTIGVFMVFILAGGLAPVSATAGGMVSYFQVSGGVCTSSVWTNVASDGNVPGLLSNNVGGPPMTAVVGTGSICIKVALTGVTTGSFTVTSPKLTGSLTLDSSNSYSAEAVFTSNYSGTCTTVPLFISPSGTVGSTSGQINHVFVGTGCSSVGVPEFPIAGLGLLVVLAVSVPLLLVARKWRAPLSL